jgi:hypothetical protein
MDIDGWLGLKLNVEDEEDLSETPNIMDQLVYNKLISEKNKTFAIYIADENDKSNSSI